MGDRGRVVRQGEGGRQVESAGDMGRVWEKCVFAKIQDPHNKNLKPLATSSPIFETLIPIIDYISSYPGL